MYQIWIDKEEFILKIAEDRYVYDALLELPNHTEEYWLKSINWPKDSAEALMLKVRYEEPEFESKDFEELVTFIRILL